MVPDFCINGIANSLQLALFNEELPFSGLARLVAERQLTGTLLT